MGQRSVRHAARHARAPRNGRLRRAWRIAAGASTVAVVAVVAIVAIAVANIGGGKPSVKLVDPVTHKVVTQQEALLALHGAFNVLLVGSDTRTGQGGQFSDQADQAASSGLGNNDVTMMLHINASHTAATVVSFPRDTELPIPPCPALSGAGKTAAISEAMLNVSFPEGGMPCTVLTIEQLLGISNIDYAASITFDGVVAMSDAVGGVPVCLATPIDDPYTGIKLPAGTSVLSGAQALAFLRSRHGVEDGSDLARISSQQNFLSSLMRTITSHGVLSDPLTLLKLGNAAISNMTLSDTMRNPRTIAEMALALKGIPMSQITFVQYPVVTDPTNVNRVVPDAAEGAVLANAIRNDLPVTLTAGTGRGAQLAAPHPAATATAPSSAPSAAVTASGTPTATSTPTPSSVALGQNATGQTAAEQTCTKGVTG
ncbi:MAG: LCP family protein [Microbacteriaceae bacterium]|nr:LCP family protein [Microbacteriaceae bacterium]